MITIISYFVLLQRTSSKEVAIIPAFIHTPSILS